MSLKTKSIAVLIGIGLITAFFGYQLRNIGFDYDLEMFYPLHDENTQFYKDFTKKFESDSDFLFVGLTNEQGIFEKDFLKKVDSLTQKLSMIEHVLYVQSPTNIRQIKRPKFGSKPIQSKFLHIENEALYSADSAVIYNTPQLVDFLFAEDRKSVMLFIKNTQELGDQACGKLAFQVDSVVQTIDFDEYHVAGKCVGQTTFINIIRYEAGLFTVLSAVLIVLFLFIAYRKFWGVWMPLAVVALAVLWTIGFMLLTGKKIDIISNVIPTILLIIGVSDAIHLLTNYLSNLKEGRDKWSSLRKSMREVGAATLLTTFTTAIGFITLTTSSFAPLVDLGFYATIGLLLAFLLTYTFMPATILLHKPLYAAEQMETSFWEKPLTIAYKWVVSHPRTILIASGLVAVLGVIGITQIKVDNYILQDLKQDHPMRTDFEFISEKFCGVRPFEMEIAVKDTSKTVFDHDVLEELSRIDSFLTTTYEVNALVSPAQVVKFSNQIYHFGREAYFKIPTTATETQILVNRLERYNNSAFFNKNLMIAEGEKIGRVSAKMPDWGSTVVQNKNAALYEFIEKELPESLLTYRVTGSAHLMDLNTNYLAQNVLQGLVIAFVVIGILFSILMRSVKVIFISLLPNILPLLFIGGMMGFAGIDLRISTSIIFIISFGIAVDDSIHFLSRFRREIQHHTVEEAVRITFMTTGKAIIVTSLVLMGGFLILCTSNFLGTFYIGLLVATTLTTALVADLTLLPILLLWFFKKYGNPLEKKPK